MEVQTTGRSLETLQLRIIIEMAKFLDLKDLLELSQVSKILRKNVSKTILPLLKPHFEIKSYIEKYPYLALRGALNRKIWVIENNDLDFLLAKIKFEEENNILIKDQNQSKTEKPNQNISKIKTEIPKGKNRKNSKSGKIVKKKEEKKKKNKLISVLPGTCITEINSTLKFIALTDKMGDLHIMNMDLFGKYSKIKSFNIDFVIKNIVKREFGYTLVWENKVGELKYLDSVGKNPKNWEIKVIKGKMEKGEMWATGYTQLILIAPNPEEGNYTFNYYENFPELTSLLEPNFTSEIDFKPRDIAIAKNYYYIISESGEIFQGEIGKFELIKISSTAKKPKKREIFKETVVTKKIIYPSGYKGEEIGDDNDAESEDILSEEPPKKKRKKEEETSNLNEYEKPPEALKIYSNHVNSFICLSDSKMKKINEFDRFELAEFFKEIGLGQYSKLILFQKINGEKLLQFNETDIEDNLGMEAVDEQNHLMLNVNHRRFDRWHEPEINVWGFNGNLELGLRTGVKTISVPHKLDIKLNDFYDFIDKVKMGNGATVILSKLKKCFIAWEILQKFDEDGNMVEEIEEEIEEEIQEDDPLQNKFKNKKGKKVKKNKKSKVNLKPVKKAGKKFEKDKWRSLNQVVESVHSGYEIEDVVTMKDKVIFPFKFLFRLLFF